MSQRYIGGFITKSPTTPTSTAAPGVWTLDQAMQYIKAGTWPTPPIGDPYWQNVSLLSATGTTNAAQNNTFLDSSTNNFTITRNGNTTQGTFTPFSQAAGYWSYYFAGGSDTVSFPDNAANDFGTGAFTVEFWVYFTSVSGQQELVTKYGSVSTGWSIQLYNGVINVNLSGDGFDITGTQTIAANTWYHIAVSGTPSSPGIKLFVNGFQDGSTYTGSTSLDSTAAVSLSGSNGRVSGYISNVRLLKGTAQYTSNFTPPTTPLTNITNTSLLTAQSNRFIDNSTANSGSGFAATIGGTPSVQAFQPFGAPTSPYSTTNVGGSGYFDGTGDFLSVPSSSNTAVGTGDFTLQMWVYDQTASGNYAMWFDMRTSGNSSYLQMYRRDDNYYGCYLNGTFYGTSNGTTWKTNQWNHCVLTRVSGTSRIFLNGTEITSFSDSNNYGANTIKIGCSFEDNYFLKGYMCGVQILKGTGYTSITVPTTPPTAISNTQLLLNFTNAGIYDQAAKNDMETVGNAQVSTSTYKYGTSSAYFDGNGDSLDLYAASLTNFQFGAGDFTVEAWIWKSANGTNGYDAIAGLGATSSATQGWYFEASSSRGLYFIINNSDTVSWSGYTNDSAWHHVAVSRSGGVLKLFYDGLMVSSATSTTAVPTTATVARIGNYYNGTTNYYFNGYISNLRITKGLGRYTYNFTPPTQAFGTIYAAPVTPADDPYFDYTTLLLPGNGTNGAQNNTFLDSSTNNFSITRNGNTTQGTFSPFSQPDGNWSVYFNGTNSYVQVASNAAFQFGTGSFTIEGWYYIQNLGANRGGYGPTLFNIGTYNNAGAIMFSCADYYIGGSGVNWQASGGTTYLQNNAWNHIAFVRNSSDNSLKVYANGVLAYSTTNTTNMTPTATVTLGDRADLLTTGPLQGYISNFRILKGTALYTGSTYTVPTTPLTNIANTSLLTCQSNRFLDNSSNSFAVVPYNSAATQQFAPYNPTAAWSASTNGGSGYFDGSGDYLNTASNAAFTLGSTGDFTVECWAYLNGTQSDYAMLMANMADFGSSYTNRWALVITSTNELRWYGSNGIAQITSTLVPYTWYHIAACRSGSTITMYVNGTSVGTQTTNQSYTTDGALSLGFIANAGTYFKGYLASARVLKGTAAYTTNFTPPTAPATNVTNTSALLNFTNAGIYDATAKNDLETLADAQISSTQAKWGSTSIKFDGTGDGLTVPDSPLVQLGAGDFTIEFWFYPSALTGYVLGKGDAATVAGSAISFQVNVAWDFYYGSSYISVTSPTFTTGSWQHCAVTRYGPTIKIFKDGNLVGSGTISTNTINTGGTNPLSIGRYAGSSSNGYIQDFRLTKGIARYTQNFTPPAAAFQLY